MKNLPIISAFPFFSLLLFSLLLPPKALAGNTYADDNLLIEMAPIPSIGDISGEYRITQNQNDCFCWGREDDAFSIASVGNNQWYVFKGSGDCQRTPISSLLGSANGCQPWELPNVRRVSRLVVPAFAHPYTNPDYWRQLNDAATQLGSRLVVIANVNNGPLKPDGSVSGSYTRAINELQTRGATVLGYVDLDKGNRPSLSIIRDLNSWLVDYDIEGIFFDRAFLVSPENEQWPADKQVFYRDLYAVTSAQFQSVHGIIPTVFFNPGAIPPSAPDFWSLSDHQAQIVAFESSSSSFANRWAQLDQLNDAQKARSVLLIHSLPDRYNWLAAVDKMQRHQFSDFFLNKPGTALAAPGQGFHNWNRLPDFFAQLVSYLVEHP